MKNWNLIEKIGAIVAVVAILGGVAWYASKDIGSSSAFTVLPPNTPTVHVQLDASSPLSDLVIGGEQHKESAWRFSVEYPVGSGSLSNVVLAGITYTLHGASYVIPNAIEMAYVRSQKDGRLLGSSVPVWSGDRWVLPIMFNEPMALAPYKVFDLFLDMAEVNGESVRNDGRYDTAIDRVEDVFLVQVDDNLGSLMQVPVKLSKNNLPVYNYVFESKPYFTVSPLSPIGDLPLTENTTVGVFRVTADSAEDITLEGSEATSNGFVVIGEAFINDVRDPSYSIEVKLIDRATGRVFGLAPTRLEEGRNAYRWVFNAEYDLAIPAGGYKDFAVVMDTTQFENLGDSIRLALLDDNDGNVCWGIAGHGTYRHAAILFRGDIYAHTLVKA